MNKKIGLSGVAVAALLLAMAPAYAQLNIGGGGGSGISVEGDGGLLGGSGDSEGTVDVDLGLNGDDDLIDLDGNGIIDADETNANITLFGPAKMARPSSRSAPAIPATTCC